MASNQPAKSSASVLTKWKTCIETHQKSMRNAISAQRVFDQGKVNEEHDKVFSRITSGFNFVDKWDMWELLRENWYNIVDHQEKRILQTSTENVSEGHLCIYLTLDWIYLVGYTENMEGVNINLGDSNDNQKSGFAARIKYNGEKLAWSDDYDNLKMDSQGKPLQDETLEYHIDLASNGDLSSRELIKELFLKVKELAEERMEETMSQVLVVTPTYFNFRSRTVLRECYKKVGFKRISLLSESSLGAYSIICNSSQTVQNKENNSVLVVNIFAGISLLVYGCILKDGKINGVQLQSAAFYDPSKIDAKIDYKRVLSRMNSSSQNAISHYVVFNKHNNTAYENTIDGIFRDEEKLIKAENTVGDNLKEVFSNFASNSDKFETYLQILASIPNDNNEGPKENDIPDETPLNKPKTSSEMLQLIGNCVAHKNGTESLSVKGIKRGSLILSQIDRNHLVMGEVGLVCTIKGLGDTVFVGVKFLALGTSGIVIDHVDVAQGFCDKCKGRRSLFIPHDQIGNSNDHLFQVQ